MKKNEKPIFKKTVKISPEIEVAQILFNFKEQGIPLEQILIQLGNYYFFEGSAALTGLPIVTNKESVKELEYGLICKYVLEHWEEVKEKAFQYFKDLEKKKNEKKKNENKKS